MLKWHKSYCLYTYILSKTKYFSYCGGVRVGIDELIWTMRAIFIFISTFYAIIEQHEIFDKKLPNLIISRNS